MTNERTLTTEQIDALIRRLDVASPPDPAFAASSYTALVGRVQAARARDASWHGRLRRALGLAFAPASHPAAARSIRLAGIVLLLVLALAVAVVIVGALNRHPLGGNGLLVVSVKGQLEAIDPASGSSRAILAADEEAEGVSRSPDGRLATFWIHDGARSRLFAIGIDGRDRRELASDLSVTWNASIDTWSSDSRFLATEVTLEGRARVLLVEVATGAARPVTPAGVVAHNPLWSPDDQWIAFTPETPTGRGLSVIRTDGTRMHDIGGNLRGLDVAGPDTWSPDGEWIYFGAGDAAGWHVYRANVSGGFRQQLTSDGLMTGGVASSPDGARIAFMVNAPYGWDLWVADSDGRAPHRVLESAGLGGWSSDGRYILVRWKPSDDTLGGLATVRPDGTGLTVLVPFDASCRHGWDEGCVLGFGWGQARP